MSEYRDLAIQEEKSPSAVMLVVLTENLFNTTELKNGEADEFCILYICYSRNNKVFIF